MELEAIRMLAAGAADPTIGVNAMLAALPLDGTDARPANVTVYNSVDDGWVARHSVPEKGGNLIFPALAILVSNPATLEEVHTAPRDGSFSFALAYVQVSSDSAKGNRDGLYVCRAVLRFLSKFADPANGAMRVRGGVQLINPTTTTQPPIWEKWDAGLVTAGIVSTWRVRDTNA